MRSLKPFGLAALSLSFAASMAWAADQPKPKTAGANDPYPAEVSLLDEPPKGWTFRQSPDNFPLYIYDKDKTNASTCYGPCLTRFTPLETSPTAKALGEWTVVKRTDGKTQWAYRGHPVYLLIQDSVQTPNGDGVDGVWHLMPHFQ